MKTRTVLNLLDLPSRTMMILKNIRYGLLKGIMLLVLFCCCVAVPVAADADSHTKENILILNSYHPGYKWTDDVTRGILDGLQSMKDASKFYIEYMGTKWANSPPYFDSLVTTYREKYRDIRFSVIFVTDNDAFEFVLAHRNSIFGNVPVVFCGVNWFRDRKSVV